MSSGVYDKFTGYHNRRSIRLRDYDYSQPGYYFITICIHDRTKKLFGDIIDGKMMRCDMGNIAYSQFKCLPKRFPNIKLDVFQIMPNHVHAVIPIRATRNSIPNFVGATLAVAHDVDTVARNSVAHDADMVVQNTPAVAGHKSDVQNNTTMVGTVEGATARIAPTKIMNPKISENMKKITIGDIVGAYKSLVANACLKIYKSKNERMGILWQRNYYEHIIRDNKSLHFIRKYIQENPLNWFDDMENHLNKEILELEMVEIREP